MTDGPGPPPPPPPDESWIRACLDTNLELLLLHLCWNAILYLLGTFLEKNSAYERLYIVPIKGVECQTERCDVSEFRFKIVVYLSGI